MVGARVFVALAFLLLGASFLLSTGILINEFRDAEWRSMVVVHSHLFFFFPVFFLTIWLSWKLSVRLTAPKSTHPA